MSPRSSKKSGAARKKTPSKKKAAAKKSPVKKKKAAAKKKATGARKAASGRGAKKKVSKKAKKAPAKKKTAKVLTPAEKRAQTLELRRQRAAERRRKAAFRKLLMEKHQSLLQAYAASKGDTRMQTRDGTEDYIDYAVSSYDRDFLLSLTELDRWRLRLVEEALKRLDSGEYGRCQQCGLEIPERRLEVEPWARYCIRCQELEDQGLLQQVESEADYDGDAEERALEDEDEFVEDEPEVAEEQDSEETDEEEADDESSDGAEAEEDEDADDDLAI